MKNRLLLGGILATMWAACTPATEQKTPDAALRHFCEHLNKLEMDKAALYSTEQTQKLLRVFTTELNMANDTEKVELRKQITINLQKLECKESDGQMRCQVCCDANGGEASIEMVQRDGKWFVQLTK